MRDDERSSGDESARPLLSMTSSASLRRTALAWIQATSISSNRLCSRIIGRRLSALAWRWRTPAEVDSSLKAWPRQGPATARCLLDCLLITCISLHQLAVENPKDPRFTVFFRRPCSPLQPGWRVRFPLALPHQPRFYGAFSFPRIHRKKFVIAPSC